MKITAYPLSDQAVAIEPAPNDGTWSSEIVADLDLSSASSKGWILRCPYAFEATWNGGSSPEDIDIRLEAPDAEISSFVQSYLGAGLLTFYTGYQFQTEGPHSLWVRGPINWPKDGLHPLEQIADTSLLPYTVTVTWQCTCPNQTIRFAAGEPFGTILPYAISAQGNVTLDIVPLDDDADLDAYEQAFQQLVDNTVVQSVFQRLSATPLGSHADSYLQQRDWTVTPMKKVISFSLWGENPKYTIGAIRNADLAIIFYPDWICRFYVAKNVPLSIIQELLARNNTEVFVVNEKPDWTGMFWRFFAACDPLVDIMISRDTDSRLGEREMLAVQEWENSDRGFHIMRDHPQHGATILGGMWGIKKGIIQNMAGLIENYQKGDFHQVDQNFLRELIYPLIHDNVLVHDPIFDHKPFPNQRVGYQFVGQVFDEHDQPVMSHLEQLKQFLQYQPPPEPPGNVVHRSPSTPRQIPTRREGRNSMKITAYPLYEHVATLRPAFKERAWLTENAAAELALSTANGTGWMLLCPQAFEATWNGGPAPEDIAIQIEAPDAAAPPFVQSQLGAGMLTLYPGYQFKTEGEQVLWVRGPINLPKHGLYPLESIVDTSLLPCTITINWKFTCPGQTIRFAAGEPFGTILPYPKHDSEPFAVQVVRVGEALEAYEQAFQQLSQAPDVQDVLRRLQGVGEPAAAQLTDPPPFFVIPAPQPLDEAVAATLFKDTHLARISVILPALNEDILLERAIEQFAATLPANCEIIVVDDNGSNDDRADFLVNQTCERASLIQSAKPRAGVRNRGLEAARGEVVVFADTQVELPAHWWQPLVATPNRPNVGVVGPSLHLHEHTMQPHLRVIRLGSDSELTIKVRAALDIAYAATINPDHGFYAIDGMSGKRYRLFINTLVSSIKDARYLEVGVWKGSTFCSAIYNNEISAVAIDNWSEFGGPRAHFLANLAKFGTPQAKVDFIEADFRNLDYSSIGKFNIFFFDGPHSYQDQYDGIVLIEKALDETFILIVDDWNLQEVRDGTLHAIRHLGFNTIFSIEIRTTLDRAHTRVHSKHSDWHNGCFVAVLKRIT